MSRSKYRAVIDTNVLYAGLYSSEGASYRILQKIEQSMVVPVLSTTLLFEYEDVLKRNQAMLNLSDRAIEAVLDGLCSRGEYQKVYFLWRPQLADPKDDHVLELAVAAGGVDIVTHNTKDFLRTVGFGIRIMKPSELLGELK